MFRREWRQQILVLALLTVAVAAAIASVTIAYNAGAPDDAEFGSASYLLRFDGTDPRSARGGTRLRQEVVRDDRGDRLPLDRCPRQRRQRGVPRPGAARHLRERAPRTPPGQLPGGSTAGSRHRRCRRPPRARARGHADPRWTSADRRRHRREPASPDRRVRPGLAGIRGSARHRHAAGRRGRRIDRPLSCQSAGRPVRLVRVRVTGEERPADGRAGDVLGGHRLPASGLAGRGRGLRRHRTATNPPARDACRDRRDAEAPATRAADERRRRRRHRRGAWDSRRSGALVRGPPDPRDRVRPPHRPSQPALDAACARHPRRNARRHRRRLVAGAGGHPHPGHTRPLCTTPEAEARTSFGNAGRPVDRGRRVQPRVRRPHQQAPDRGRASGDDTRHACSSALWRSASSPGPAVTSQSLHAWRYGISRAIRPVPGLHSPRSPSPSASQPRSSSPRQQKRSRRTNGWPPSPRTSPTGKSGSTPVERETLSSSRCRSRRLPSLQEVLRAFANSPQVSVRPS